MMGDHEQRPCTECGSPLTSKRRDALTCSSRCRSRRSRRLRWRQVSPNLQWREGAADPSDEMFGRMHIVAPTDPDAPETGGKVAKAKVEFKGLRPVDPHAPWTIHMRETPYEEQAGDSFTLGAAALFWLNDHLGEDVRVSIYAGRELDGPPLLAVDAIGELRHQHLSNGEDVWPI